MGFHFSIVFGNSKTNETETAEFFSVADYGEAWKKVAEIAFDMLKGKCEKGDFYWYIQNISDVTRR